MSSKIDKKFSEIVFADIEAAVKTGFFEDQNTEFKQVVWDRTDEGIREMLRDVSSLANAYGGVILVGLEENEDGQATNFHAVSNVGEERDRIFSSCLANLQPRIAGLDIKPIDMGNGQAILAIKVPNSFNLHQITFKGLYQFWKRHDRQKSRMSVEEIKDAILKNDRGSQDTGKFIQERLRLRKLEGRIFVISAMPVKSERQLFEISNSQVHDVLRHSDSERHGGWNFNFAHSYARPTLHGLRIVLGDGQAVGKSLDFFRNGYLEGVVTISPDYFYENRELHNSNGEVVSSPLFRNIAIVEYLYSFTKRLNSLLEIIGYEGSYAISVSLSNINGFSLSKYRPSALFATREIGTWGENDLDIPIEVFEDLNPERMTKYIADRIWQAFGFEHEPFFENGVFKFSS